MVSCLAGAVFLSIACQVVSCLGGFVFLSIPCQVVSRLSGFVFLSILWCVTLGGGVPRVGRFGTSLVARVLEILCGRVSCLGGGDPEARGGLVRSRGGLVLSRRDPRGGSV